MKHIHCPVRGWDCPYYIDSRTLPSEDGDVEEFCLCGMHNPMEHCSDFVDFWGGYSEKSTPMIPIIKKKFLTKPQGCAIIILSKKRKRLIQMKMSEHTKTDRLDRMVYIATTVGFGNVVFEKVEEDKRECLTDTGVLLVKALEKDFLITAFIVTLDKASALYKSAGYERMPDNLYRKIQKNKIHIKKQNEVRF